MRRDYHAGDNRPRAFHCYLILFATLVLWSGNWIVALGSLLLAYAGWSYVVKRLGAARAGATMHLMPAIAVALAALFLGEVPLWYHFAGIALILAGVALSTFKVASVSSTP